MCYLFIVFQTPQKTANSPSVQVNVWLLDCVHWLLLIFNFECAFRPGYVPLKQTPGQNAERLQKVRDMVSHSKLLRSSFEHPVKDGDLLSACKACSPRYSPVRKSPSLRSPLSTLTNR